MCPIPLSNVFVLIFRSDVHKGDDQVPHFTVSIYDKEVLFASAHIYTVVINGVHVCIFHSILTNTTYSQFDTVPDIMRG